MREQEVRNLWEAYLEVCEAKDETEEGITGQPIPKRKLGPAKRHEFEKKRREERKKRNDPREGDSFSQHRMTGSRGHGSEYENTRSVREEVLSYLLDEGFASDEKSAEAIMGAMSEAWIESIVEAKVDKKLPEHERSGARLSRYDNPSGALALGGGQQRARREEHKERRGKKKD